MKMDRCNIAGASSKENPKKPGKQCWGCGKKEVNGERQFQQCPKCSSLFCSDECYRENWQKHKTFHKGLKNIKKRYPILPYPDKIVEQDASPYRTRLLESLKFYQMGDIANAKKPLRKAIKANPDLPEAYTKLAMYSALSCHYELAASLFETGIELWARFCLTGQYGDENKFENKNPEERSTIEGQAMVGFANTVELFIQEVYQGRIDDRKKPAWLCNDFILKRIMDVVLCILMQLKNMDPKRLQAAYVYQSQVLFGSMHEGKLLEDFKYVKTFKSRSKKDIEGALEYLRKASMIEGGKFDPDIMKCMKDNMVEYSKTVKSTPLNTTPFYKGCFVIIVGLTSSVGRKMNEKVGIVNTSRSKDDRYGIEIDGIDKPKSIKAENLIVLTLDGDPMRSDFDIALVSCMSSEDRWRYLRRVAVDFVKLREL